MTGDAGCIQRLIGSPSLGLIAYRAVALPTGDIAVGAIEGEPALRMVEGRWFPSSGRVTLGTLRGTVDCKLGMVNIRMTSLTVNANTRELDQRAIARRRQVSVALIAGNADMFPFEGEITLRMIIENFVPGSN